VSEFQYFRLFAAMGAIGVQPGDEVIVSPIQCQLVAMLQWLGEWSLVPFADIDPILLVWIQALKQDNRSDKASL
jgi:hypothetical protein